MNDAQIAIDALNLFPQLKTFLQMHSDRNFESFWKRKIADKTIDFYTVSHRRLALFGMLYVIGHEYQKFGEPQLGFGQSYFGVIQKLENLLWKFSSVENIGGFASKLVNMESSSTLSSFSELMFAEYLELTHCYEIQAFDFKYEVLSPNGIKIGKDCDILVEIDGKYVGFEIYNPINSLPANSSFSFVHSQIDPTTIERTTKKAKKEIGSIAGSSLIGLDKFFLCVNVAFSHLTHIQSGRFSFEGLFDDILKEPELHLLDGIFVFLCLNIKPPFLVQKLACSLRHEN
jgi:hypothetical protein